MLQLNHRLFPHAQGGFCCFHAGGQAIYTIEDFRIVKQQACDVARIEKQFIQFCTAVPHYGRHYGLLSGQLVCFSVAGAKILAYAPSSSEKYKLASFSDQLYCLSEAGKMYAFDGKQFSLADASFLKGDSYIYSQIVGDENVEIAVNLTSQLLYFKRGEDIFQQQLEQLITVDIMTPFYVLLHNERSNVLVDLTVHENGFEIYSTEQRVKQLEWNRLSPGLRLLRDIWLCGDAYLTEFSKLNVSALNARIRQLMKLDVEQENRAPDPRFHKLESNEIWRFGPANPDVPDIVADMRGNMVRFKKNITSMPLALEATVADLKPESSPPQRSQKDVFFYIKKPAAGAEIPDMQLMLIQQKRRIDELEKEVLLLRKDQKLSQEIIIEIIGLLGASEKSSALGNILKRMNAE